jgi:hypothetical protein
MKFNGNALKIRETIKVTLPRYGSKIELTVSSLPMGLKKMYEETIPRPRPPFDMVNKVGKAPERVENYEDPTFIREYDEWRFLQNVYAFWSVLAGDPNLTFDNTPTDIVSMRKLEQEIRDAGISDGDMSIVLEKAAQAANISDRELETAKESL